ncbi:MAG: hypothetical protein KatS3mg002_1130 [Candidatus Woesearchaeota archaeon]|nr:MAG: hypothetical protein KatS3mg002_1130 [Candidatus Woesearchaeota archaeon]
MTFSFKSEARGDFGICAIPVLAFYQKNKMNQKKQKTLLPTLKERQRYVVYELKADKKINHVWDKIIEECNNLLGVFEAGKAGIMNVVYNEKNNKGIIRVNNKYVDKIKVCLGMIISIENINVNINCIYVSGMINKAKDKIIN